MKKKYTGYKDSNNKKLYEGDTIEIHQGPPFKAKIELHDDGWNYVPINPLGCAYTLDYILSLPKYKFYKK